MADKVRVLRLIEYRGPRVWVENQVRNSLHGTKEVSTGNGMGYITVVTVGEFTESIAEFDFPQEPTKLVP